MRSYFKVVVLREGKEDWILSELEEGRVHFGWGSPGTDLRIIEDIPRAERTAEQTLAWEKSRFLLKRLTVGNRLVVQLSRPLRQFLIAEITGEYSFLDPPEDDFNHTLPCELLTPRFVDINASYVPLFLKHDLGKIGRYYEIYPERSVRQLDWIVSNKRWERPDDQAADPIEDELDATWTEVIEKTLAAISGRWKGIDFERFVARLIDRLPGVSVKHTGDSRKGWDLTVSVMDPLTDEVLFDNVPVQCKAYTGPVSDLRPIEDLERCIRQSQATCAYLFITGELSKDFEDRVSLLQEKLSLEMQRDISLRVVGAERIAELYLQYMGEQICGTDGDEV
ncbi:MAG: restriction endonuclease [Actinobacteria bacterium]|jgi:hypothetical protein|nr:restriction endonuclease [Actinomycetota bacterium]